MFKHLLLTMALLAAPVYAAESDLQVAPTDTGTVSGQSANLLQPGGSQLQSGAQQINQNGANNSLQSAGTNEQLRQYLEGEIDSSQLSATVAEGSEAARQYFWLLIAVVLAGGTWLALDYRRHVRL